jgi:hypothetical protein
MKMGPNKLENQIQQKLNSREIQPSAQAWDRLDAMLTVAEEKKIKKSPFLSFRFIGIAASFLVFLAIGKFVYDDFQNSKFKIQNSNSIIVKSDAEVPEENPKLDNQIPTNKSQISKVIQVIAQNHQPSTSNHQPKRVSIINQNQSNPIVEVIPKKVETPQPLINQDIVVNLKNDIAEVEIPVKKEVATSKIKVNATSLLSQVDGELNQTYRETKLEKIARNLNSVKVALANRNNQ